MKRMGAEVAVGTGVASGCTGATGGFFNTLTPQALRYAQGVTTERLWLQFRQS